MSEAQELVDSPFGFELEHLSPVIGTVVHGIDLRVVPNEDLAEWLAAANHSARSSFGTTRRSIP